MHAATTLNCDPLRRSCAKPAAPWAAALIKRRHAHIVRSDHQIGLLQPGRAQQQVHGVGSRFVLQAGSGLICQNHAELEQHGTCQRNAPARGLARMSKSVWHFRQASSLVTACKVPSNQPFCKREMVLRNLANSRRHRCRPSRNSDGASCRCSSPTPH